MTNNENNDASNSPENNPPKPMDTKREVANSPDEKTDQDFPGYPHYPAKEDIMDQRSGAHEVDADLQNMGTGPNASGVNQRFLAGQDSGSAKAQRVNRENEDHSGPGANEEIGVPQNVTNSELNSGEDLPGTDVDEAAEKGSLNP